jgi:hypothetical protein
LTNTTALSLNAIGRSVNWGVHRECREVRSQAKPQQKFRTLNVPMNAYPPPCQKKKVNNAKSAAGKRPSVWKVLIVPARSKIVRIDQSSDLVYRTCPRASVVSRPLDINGCYGREGAINPHKARKNHAASKRTVRVNVLILTRVRSRL